LKFPVTIGDRVFWYDYYADGSIVRDAGRGIVIDERHTNLDRRLYAQYAVLRDGSTEVEWRSRWEIETMEEYDERIKSQSENKASANADRKSETRPA
tara:strand:+ start:88 stop:378 length:291 start_codon:yes stop_codon:yes gene_type:complete